MLLSLLVETRIGAQSGCLSNRNYIRSRGGLLTLPFLRTDLMGVPISRANLVCCAPPAVGSPQMFRRQRTCGTLMLRRGVLSAPAKLSH